MRKLIITSIILTISGCNIDNPTWIPYKYGQKSFGVDTYASGKPVSKFCRSWYYYTYYKQYCKSQKCKDEYEKRYNRSRLVREIGRNKTEELCLSEANSNQ